MGPVDVIPGVQFSLVQLTSAIEWTNQFVLAYWPWLFGGVIVFVGLVVSYLSHRDKQWSASTTVSTDPLDADESVSVLLPAWSEATTIGDSVAAFRNISYENRELIICAGGEDDTYQRAVVAAKDDGRIHVVEQTEAMNKQAALNACLERADGEVLYLIDGDCVLDNETWNAILRPVVESEESAATGTSRPLKRQWGLGLPSYQYVKEEFYRAHSPRYVRGLLGRNAVLRREVIEELGGFDESVEAGTDYNLAKRLVSNGYQIRFVLNSCIQSHHPTTVREYLDQQSRWIRNVFFLGWKWGELRGIRTTVITCSVGVVMLILPLLGLVWLPALVAWTGLVTYGAFSRWRWIVFFKRLDRETVPKRLFLVSVPLMFVEFVAWAYTLVEILVPSRRRKW